ncbi:MAG: DAK2 domain-containing protein [Chloroflexia bacterium]|nr:DAK2 domain-containing protein [Chloroflexia bacterium]
MSRNEPVMVAKTAPADGPALLAATRVATDWLARHRDRINALNVFPVPDGDTGTNMLLTLREAVAAGEAAARTDTRAGIVAAAIAHGAFIGARGNSGVILCQMIGGFAAAIADRSTITGSDVAAALAGAQARAYRAVLDPVEGTMLTVVRVAAEHAASAAAAADGVPDLETVLTAALRGARTALATTPDLLDILKAANVVDAGGQGVVHFLEGLTRFATGKAGLATEPDADAAHPIAGEMAFLDLIPAAHGDDAYGYCVNFVVFTEDAVDFEAVRARLGDFGQSAEVMSDERALRVHLHTENPGPVLDYAAGLGQLDRIQIDNMTRQTKRLIEARAASCHVAQANSPGPTPAALESSDLEVLAIVPGPGLGAAFRSLGAAVVTGGQAMNPSTAEILAGIDSLAASQVIVLPNNPNIFLAAEQAATLTEKHVQVVPSRSVPQGLAALAALTPRGSLDDNAPKMTRALAHVRTVEVTHASRDAVIDDVEVRARQAIGFLDETLVAAGIDQVDVAIAAVNATRLDDAELITIFTGAGVSPEAATALRDALRATAPRLTVEMVEGGQPHFPFVISVE